MNIQEANKLIAEFMDGSAEYHSSWDALMPVIVKLKQEVQFICFSQGQAQELVDDIDDSIRYCEGILVTHECVMAFIKQLNQDKQSNG